MDNVLEVQLDLIKPAGERDPETDQLVIEQHTETLGTAIREMQQRLTDERRENENIAGVDHPNGNTTQQYWMSPGEYSRSLTRPRTAIRLMRRSKRRQ